MAKEQFFHRASQEIFGKVEELSRRSNVSRGQAFEDWLTAMVCALAAETMEPQYMAMVERHKKGKKGKRGIDLMPQMFAGLIDAMSKSDADILGDVFQGCISYGEAGQFFTPEAITKMLAKMTIDPHAEPTDGKPILVNDPCCGTGRMLMEAARINPKIELVGQDIDARCARITAINLGLRGMYGWVVCGNALSGESQFAYRVGAFFHESPQGRRRGVIREVPVESTPVPVISSRVREKVKDMFAEPASAEPVTSDMETFVLPKIMEVPAWLARLEAQLAHTEPAESGADAIPQEALPVEESPPDPVEDTPRVVTQSSKPQQRTLF